MPPPSHKCEYCLIDSATDPAMGRWATLKDAAGVLETQPLDLLKQVKKGKRRATKIGNNWFVYLDAAVQQAATDRLRAVEEKHAVRKKALDRLRKENEQLRADIAAARKAAPAEATPPEGIGRQLAPLLEGIERHHRSMNAEIEFLRSELVATRQQHADEMRRKDILLQQAHKTLQDVVKLGLPGPKAPPAAPAPEVDRLRQDQARMSRVMGEMSELLTLMYTRLRRPGQ
jgi:hypothetical protein